MAEGNLEVPETSTGEKCRNSPQDPKSEDFAKLTIPRGIMRFSLPGSTNASVNNESAAGEWPPISNYGFDVTFVAYALNQSTRWRNLICLP